MSLNIGELVGYISVDKSKWDSGLKGAQDDLTRLGTEGEKKGGHAGQLIGAAIGAGVVFGLAKLKQFTFGAVDAFAAVQDATGAAGGIFGNASDSIVDFAEKAAKSFGLSKRAALESQNNFAMMGKAAGISVGQLAGWSQELARLAGDMASYYGGTAEKAATAVSAALRGEMEPIRAYNVLLDEQTLRVRAVTMGLINNVKEGLTPANKVLAAHAEILAKTTYLQGDYAKYAYYTANVQKTLAAETENAQVKLGEKLAPTITKVRLFMLGLVLKMSDLIGVIIVVNRWIGDHSTLMKTAAFMIGLVVAAVVAHNIAMAISSGRLVAWIAQTIIVRGVTAAWTAAQWLLNAALTANPIGVILVALAALVVAVVFAYTHIDRFRAGVNTDLNAVLKAFQYMTNGVIAAVNLMIRAWNKIPWHDDIDTLSNVEFPQLATAAELAAERVAKALADAKKNASFIGPVLTQAQIDARFIGPRVSEIGSYRKPPPGVGGDSGAGLKADKAKVKKIYKDMKADIAAFLLDRSDLTKAAGLREIAAQERFNDTSFNLHRSFNKAMESAQESYQDRVTQLNQDAVSKRQSVVQKSMDMLRGAFASATSVDIGGMFSGGVTGLLAGLKTKLFGARDLAKNAATLAAEGYSQTFIQQVVAQGPDAGNAMSKAILEATPEAAGELKNLFSEIQDVSDTGLDALATSMNSGVVLATRALMAEYANVGVELQVLLTQSHEALAGAQASALQTLTEGLADANKDLASALLDSATQFNDSLEALQRDSMAKLAALQAELKTTAKLIASVSGASVADILRKAPSIAGVQIDIPSLPKPPAPGTSFGGPPPTIGSLTVIGYDPDEAVRKFGQELQWQMAGAW